MARPVKNRNICTLPENNHFGPLNVEITDEQVITMHVDEYETIRLIDFEGLTQAECAEQMNVARTTVQGIYSHARRKIAESLVLSKLLVIEGGEYQLCDELKGECSEGCRYLRG